MKSTRRKPRVKNQRGLVTLTLLATVLSAVALDRYPHGFAWCFLTWSAVSLLACLASRPPRVGWLYVAVLLAALGAVEIVWSLEDASREELARSLEWEVVGEDYMISRKSVLGYELVPGSRGRTVRRHPNGELIYDVVYTIDDNGLRVSPGVDPDVAAKAIVFFGGSYTFGEGVADDETLPARTGLLLGGRFAICNFALHGYGPHQMLAALEHDLVAARLEHAPAYGIYQLLPAHIERSAGPASWDSWGPRYHVDDRGRVTFQGSFAETRQQPANSLLDRLSSLAGKSKIAQRVAPVIGARRETRLFLAIVGAARDRFESSYPGRIQLVVATSRDGGVSMGVGKCQGAIRAMRGQMRSPGRPSTARREDRIRFWETIARGASSEDAATEAGVSPAVGSRWFRQAGGMRPISLAPVSGRYLSFAEREEIAILHAQHVGVREIARRLGRSPSTISRELRRNAATRSRAVTYRATTAQWHAERRASRPKVSKLAANDALREYVQNRLAGVIARPDGELVPGPDVRWIGRRHGRRQDRRWAKSWSPEQISNRLRIDFPHNESMRISHEAIYQALYIQGRGALKRELVACLRTGRALRVPHARTRGRGKKFVTPEIMISERPAEAGDRAVPGHWEGDLIVGLESSAIGTLVERTTRFTMLLHLPRMEGHGTESRVKNGPALAGHGAEAVRDAIAVSITTLPEQLRRSLTWDQGAEMAQHAQLRVDTGLAIYFCDPHSPWQRGTNENTNGLLRQYFPKGTDLVRYSCDDLAAVALALNGRPRKTLGWRTPAEVFDELVHSAHQGNAATTP